MDFCCRSSQFKLGCLSSWRQFLKAFLKLKSTGWQAARYYCKLQLQNSGQIRWKMSMNQERRGKQPFSFLFSLNSDNKLQYRSDVQKNGRVTGQISARIFQGSPFFSGIGSPTQALSKLEGNEQRPRPRLEPGGLSFFRLGICGYIPWHENSDS